MEKKRKAKKPKTKLYNIEEAAEEIALHGMREFLIKEFVKSFEDARRGKRRTFNQHSYDVNWMDNIPRLVDTILEMYYEPSSSLSFIVFEPMIREIFAAQFIDRTVHHFLYRVSYAWWDRRFHPDSYSCREGKGTQYAIERAQEKMRKVTDNLKKPAKVVKMDIKGCFMSLPRRRLYRRVKWGLDKQFKDYRDIPEAVELYKILCFLWHRVLMDDPASKSRRRGPLSNWDILPAEKSLYTREPGLGIVIGNLTSQLVANIYLDMLDRYIVHTLGYKYYGRYVDDFFIMVEEEDYAKLKRDIRKIAKFLKEEMGMTLHPKKRYVQSVYKGLPFLGARVYPHCLYPSDRLQKHFDHMLYLMKYGIVSDETVISYFGFLTYLDADKFVKKEFLKYGISYDLYLEMKNKKWPIDMIVYNMRREIHGKERVNYDGVRIREKRTNYNRKPSAASASAGTAAPLRGRPGPR